MALKTPADFILKKMLSDTGAAVGLIYGYSSDRTRMRLVAKAGVEFDFPKWDTITDCWEKRLRAHEQNNSYDLFVQDLPEGGPCRQRYIDIGCDYSLSFPIIRQGKLVGFVAALWRSVPTLTSSARNYVARASLDLTEIVDDQGYPKEAKESDIAANLATVANRFSSLAKIQIGITPDQKILYWQDTDKAFGFETPPIGQSLSQIFVDPTFSDIHEKMIERFINSDDEYKRMNMGRAIAVRSADGSPLDVVISHLEKVSTYNSYAALGMGFPVKIVPGGAIVPDVPGDTRDPLDRHEARAYRALDHVSDATQKVSLKGALGLTMIASVIIFGVLTWFGKLPHPPSQAPGSKTAK